ncbi:hypothetical protein [Microbacterium sp. OR16]|uniref:hypothetical protein n=1 Tax=Microbacterium sp. OR16 TaxID=3095345 RepID=UPI0039B3D785
MNESYPDAIYRILARFARDWPVTIDVGPGWFPLLARLDERLSEVSPHYVVHQVKSKFGSLSFYAQCSDDPQDYNEALVEAIRAAEWESTTACEECGEPAGTYTIGMWVWTLCSRHASEKLTPDDAA